MEMGVGEEAKEGGRRKDSEPGPINTSQEMRFPRTLFLPSALLTSWFVSQGAGHVGESINTACA